MIGGVLLLVAGVGVIAWISFVAVPALVIVHFIAVLPEERYPSELERVVNAANDRR